MACLLLRYSCMLAKTHTDMGRGLFPAEFGYVRDISRNWMTAIIIAVAFIVMFLIMQSGKVDRVERGVQLSFSRAWHLLHEADKENRKVRPMPLSLASSAVASAEDRTALQVG
jgi:hypothetical protein